MKVVVVRLFLELCEHAIRLFVSPIAQENDVLSVVREWLGLPRIDHERPVDALLFLKPGVTVVPIRPALANIESVCVSLARADAMKAEARHAIHVRGQQNAVPVN